MFLHDRANVIEFCRLLTSARDLAISWSVFARVDAVEPEILAIMKKAGCWQVGFGLESGHNSAKILKSGQPYATIHSKEGEL